MKQEAAATGIYFFGIYWDFLINPHTFWNKSHRIPEGGSLHCKKKSRIINPSKGFINLINPSENRLLMYPLEETVE
jgi:hypothetical protein